MPEYASDTTEAPTGKGRPTVSAVVMNYNGGDKVMKAVEALTRQIEPLAEIIVCDNASTDDSPDRVREQYPQARVHAMPGNDGLPSQRNGGLKESASDLVFFIDSDVYPEPGCIAKLVDTYLAHDKPAVVCPRIRLIPETDTVQCEGASTHFLGMMMMRHANRLADELPDTPVEVHGCIGAAYLFDRQRVIDAGGFDPIYWLYFEDTEFSLRMRLLGARFICEPRAVVMHDRGSGYSGLSFRGSESKYPPRRAFMQMRNRLLLMMSQYSLWTLIVLSPVLLLYEFASLAAAISKGFAWQWCRAWGWVLANPGRVMERRRSIQPRRKRHDSALLVPGPIPLAPGFVKNPIGRVLVGILDAIFNGYWALARRVIR